MVRATIRNTYWLLVELKVDVGKDLNKPLVNAGHKIVDTKSEKVNSSVPSLNISGNSVHQDIPKVTVAIESLNNFEDPDDVIRLMY